ncbi:hypothetical protein ACRAWG_32605 [Methylobacterium sp. P31]
MDVEAAKGMLVAAMDAARVPRPSFWINSGRNCQAVWSTKGAKAKGWARQKAIYAALYGPQLTVEGDVVRPTWRDPSPEDLAFEARMLPMWRLFRDFGLDHACKDAPRVVRMVGSINRKTGRLATLLWPASFDEARKYTFDELAGAILQHTRAEIRALTRARRAAKAEAAALKQADGEPTKAYTPRGYWPAVIADLWRYQAAGLVRDGVRELWMFHAANAIAHVRGGTAQSWASELAHIAGIPFDEAVSALKTLDGMQRRREAGEVDRFGRIPLYNCSAGKIADNLKLSREVAIAHGMIAIVPGLSSKEAARIRQQRRRATLFPERVAQADNANLRLAEGHIALGLRADGWSIAEIATTFGCSAGTARTWMLRAAEQLGLASIDVAALAAFGLAQASETVVTPPAVEVPANATEDRAPVHPQVWSRCIGGSKTRQAPPSSKPIETTTQPAPVAAGTVRSSLKAVPVVRPGEIVVEKITRFFAKVYTATGRWEWWRRQDPFMSGYGRKEWIEHWDRMSPGTPCADDELLAEAARRDLSSASSSRSCRPAPCLGRAASERRPAAVQRSRRMGFRSMPPLDADRTADAYRIASRGA